jgi:hypothetical protein
VDERFQFFEIGPTRDRGLRPSYYFMMRCLLCSRVETGLVSDSNGYDEDVNVYLANLLNAFINPDYVERAQRYLSPYDHEVFHRLMRSSDARLKYTIYKTNADFLLVSLGLFEDPGQVTRGGRRRARSASPSEEATMGRGRVYYHFAYSYAQQVYRKNPGIADVLEKLSRGFDRYLKVLSHMRGEYLDLLSRLTQGEVYHLERCVSEDRQNCAMGSLQDAFLDAYLDHQAGRTAETRARLTDAARRMQSVDPSFRFEVPE